jgi:O-antigen ligase
MGALTAAYTIADFFFNLAPGSSLQGGRATGVHGDPNYLAAKLIALIPLAYYLYVRDTAKWFKRFNIITICLLILGSFLTVSRAGLLTLTIIGGCLLLKNIKKYSTFLIIGAALILFSLYAKDLFLERKTVTTTLAGEKILDTSVVARLELLEKGFKLFLKNPIFGVGLDNTQQSMRDQLSVRSINIHNVYLLVLVEFGVGGFLLFMGLFWLAHKSLARLSHLPDPAFNEMAIYLRLALFSHMITSCFIGNWVELLLWITLALPVILYQISKNEDKDRAATVIT